MVKQTIHHSGVVIKSCGAGFYFVKIETKSACSACHAKKYCNASEMQDKIIEAYGECSFEIGEPVFVEMDSSLAGKAVFLSFGLPFLFMTSALFGVYSLTGSEIAGGIASLVSLVPAYLFIFIMRRSISDKFKFRVVKKLNK